MIEVGDVVMLRSGKSTSKTVLPLGIADCTVIQLGTGPSGEPCAQLELPEGFRKLYHGQPVWSLVADLEK